MKTFSVVFAVSLCFVLLNTVCYAQDSLEAKGKTLFKDFKCTSCHALEKQGILKKGKSSVPDLSEVGNKLNDEFIYKYLRKEESQNDLKHPVLFKGNDEELKTLGSWLSSLKSLGVPDSSLKK